MKSYYNFAMKKILFVVFCLFISNNCFADKLSSRLQRIESVWEQVEAKSDETQQLLAFPRLLDEATTLANEFPHRAEPIILHACNSHPCTNPRAFRCTIIGTQSPRFTFKCDGD